MSAASMSRYTIGAYLRLCVENWCKQKFRSSRVTIFCCYLENLQQNNFGIAKIMADLSLQINGKKYHSSTCFVHVKSFACFIHRSMIVTVYCGAGGHYVSSIQVSLLMSVAEWLKSLSLEP